MSHSYNKPLIGRVPIEHKKEDFLDKADNLVKKPSIGERIKQEAHEAKEWLKARVTPENSMPVPSSDKVLYRTDGHTMHPDHKIPEHYDFNKLPGHYDPDIYHPAPIAPSNQLHNIDLAAPSSHEMAGKKATNAFLLADKQRVFEERKDTAPLERVGGTAQQREMITKASKPSSNENKSYSEQLYERAAGTWEVTKSKVADSMDWVAEKVGTSSDSTKDSSEKLKSAAVEIKEDIKGKASEIKNDVNEAANEAKESKEWAGISKTQPEYEKTLSEKIKDSAEYAWDTVKFKAAETQDWLERKLPSDSEKMSGELKETPQKWEKDTQRTFTEKREVERVQEQFAKKEKIDLVNEGLEKDTRYF